MIVSDIGITKQLTVETKIGDSLGQFYVKFTDHERGYALKIGVYTFKEMYDRRYEVQAIMDKILSGEWDACSTIRIGKMLDIKICGHKAHIYMTITQEENKDMVCSDKGDVHIGMPFHIWKRMVGKEMVYIRNIMGEYMLKLKQIRDGEDVKTRLYRWKLASHGQEEEVISSPWAWDLCEVIRNGHTYVRKFKNVSHITDLWLLLEGKIHSNASQSEGDEESSLYANEGSVYETLIDPGSAKESITVITPMLYI